MREEDQLSFVGLAHLMELRVMPSFLRASQCEHKKGGDVIVVGIMCDEDYYVGT